MQITKPESEGFAVALKSGADITRSPKQGHQWSHKKDLSPQKIIK